MKVASVVAVLLVSAVAHAQGAEAEALFREGKKLLKQGKTAEACDKFEASERIESTVGALLNLADCREKNGQLATAWATFGRAATSARLAHDAKRETEAERREKLLEPKLAYITISVDAPVAGLEITRNDAPLDKALWNQRVPIDPGTYLIAAQAPDHAKWSKRVDVGSAKKVELSVPKLDPIAVPPAEDTEKKVKPKEVTGQYRDRVAPEPEEEPPPSSWTGTRKVAILVGFVGLGATGVGTYFAITGRNQQRDSNAICPTTTCDDQTALDLNKKARKNALYANISWGAGGALVVTSIIMYAVGGPKHFTPIVASDHAGVSYQVSF